MLQIPGRDLGLRGEILGSEALRALTPAWDDLCTRTIEDNVYYTPRYARALIDNVEKDKKIAFAVVWNGARLVALLPFTRRRLRAPLLQPAGRAWKSKYSFSCMPVLDKDCAVEAASALLDVLSSVNAGEWIIPTVNVEGAACRAVTSALAGRLLPWSFAGHFRRAVLKCGDTFEQHMKDHVSAKRRKDIARNRRRLEQMGQIAHETYICGQGLRRAVAAFLELEARGWKGKQGTALACSERTRKFAIDAFEGDESQSPSCRADMLTLNGAPIAVGVIAFAGSTGFTVKCTYDEAYRSFSAGLLLEIEVIRSLLTENWTARLDSATSGTHVIDDLWGDRIEVADLIFSLSPRYAALRLAAFRLSDLLWRKARAKVKSWLA